MKSVIFHPLARQELANAVAYYEAQRPGLGLEYLEEVENTVNLLRLDPEAGSTVRGFIRRLVLPKFPYSVLYRPLENNPMRILALAHHKRRPQYWKSRKSLME